MERALLGAAAEILGLGAAHNAAHRAIVAAGPPFGCAKQRKRETGRIRGRRRFNRHRFRTSFSPRIDSNGLFFREGTMPLFAKPACEEALILSGSCARQSASDSGWIIATTILGSSMAFIDGTVVNVALPALQSGLGATLSEIQWVVEAYALFLAALVLAGGSRVER